MLLSESEILSAKTVNVCYFNYDNNNDQGVLYLDLLLLFDLLRHSPLWDQQSVSSGVCFPLTLTKQFPCNNYIL